MNDLLPLAFPLEVDEHVLQDLLINLGAAQQHHSKLPNPVLDRGDLEAFIRSCGAMESASQMMWGYLRDRVYFSPGYPPRLRDVLCLREMCRMFQYEARVLQHRLRLAPPNVFWEIQVGVFDRKGDRIAEAVAAGRAFDESDQEASLGAFYACAADAFRDAARKLFPFGAPYDERDQTTESGEGAPAEEHLSR